MSVLLSVCRIACLLGCLPALLLLPILPMTCVLKYIHVPNAAIVNTKYGKREAKQRKKEKIKV